LGEGGQRINQNGWYQIVGEVVNTGSDNTEFVKVVATFYDEGGTVIETDYTYTDPSDLAAGQLAPFEITLADEDIAENVESVKLTTESNDYFMIDPEVEQGMQLAEQQAEDSATTFESIADGFRVQVPSGWTVEDEDNTDPISQQAEQSYGLGVLARLCSEDLATPQIGGAYMCPEQVDSVVIVRFADLKSRPVFADVIQ
jgi:hypothetical protein